MPGPIYICFKRIKFNKNWKSSFEDGPRGVFFIIDVVDADEALFASAYQELESLGVSIKTLGRYWVYVLNDNETENVWVENQKTYPIMNKRDWIIFIPTTITWTKKSSWNTST